VPAAHLVLEVQASILHGSQTKLKLTTSAGKLFNDTKEEKKETLIPLSLRES
jgi:hypothetical protein